MKLMIVTTMVACLSGATAAFGAAGAGHGPSASWNDMQKFEYYIGDLAGALNVCRMYGLHSQMQELATLTPYGKIGLAAWASYDDIRGGVCGKVKNTSESILGDKAKLLDYLKAKYDCSSGDCVER